MDGAARLGTDDWNVHMQGEIAEATTVGQVQTIQASLSRLAQQVSRLAQQAEDKIVALRKKNLKTFGMDSKSSCWIPTKFKNKLKQQTRTHGPWQLNSRPDHGGSPFR